MLSIAEPNLARIYRKLQLIRRVEEEIARIYPSDKIKSPVHLSIGQEAVAVGIGDPLRPDDVVSGTYRSHAAYIAKGGDLPAMFAEHSRQIAALGNIGSMATVSTGDDVVRTQRIADAYRCSFLTNGEVHRAFDFVGRINTGDFFLGAAD